MLVLEDFAGSPKVMPDGTRIVLIDYTGHSLSGTFNDPDTFDELPDLAQITIGPNTFTLRYNDDSDRPRLAAGHHLHHRHGGRPPRNRPR